MKSETVFSVLAILLAAAGVALGAVSIGLHSGTQRQLDAFVAEYDERHGPAPQPARPVRPHRPGNTGAIGDLSEGE